MIRVDVLTPKGHLFEGDATFVVAPSVDGQVGILPQHAPLIALLKAGEVRVDLGNSSRHFKVDGGVLEVSKNKVTVLATKVVEA